MSVFHDLMSKEFHIVYILTTRKPKLYEVLEYYSREDKAYNQVSLYNMAATFVR